MKIIYGDNANDLNLIPENGQDSLWLHTLMTSKKTKQNFIRLYARKITDTGIGIPNQVSISIWNMRWSEIPNKEIK